MRLKKIQLACFLGDLLNMLLIRKSEYIRQRATERDEAGQAGVWLSEEKSSELHISSL